LNDDPDDKFLVRKTIAAVKAIALSVTTKNTLKEPTPVDEVEVRPLRNSLSKIKKTKKTPSRP
jgi:hypothetical protein